MPKIICCLLIFLFFFFSCAKFGIFILFLMAPLLLGFVFFIDLLCLSRQSCRLGVVVELVVSCVGIQPTKSITCTSQDHSIFLIFKNDESMVPQEII